MRTRKKHLEACARGHHGGSCNCNINVRFLSKERAALLLALKELTEQYLLRRLLCVFSGNAQLEEVLQVFSRYNFLLCYQQWHQRTLLKTHLLKIFGDLLVRRFHEK